MIAKILILLIFKGGYTTGPKQVIDLLRQRSRPYLFSNTLPPAVVAGASKVSFLKGSKSDKNFKFYKFNFMKGT